MAGISPQERDQLARQNAALMAVFERAGFLHIDPDIVQPADIFLERSGENIRARTFVFEDPLGRELCLRPDLTVPTCRYHLDHAMKLQDEARYCYLGPAFRFPDEIHSPQEFHQAGIEWFNGNNPIGVEARLLKLTLSALEAAGLSQYRVVLGDLGLFFALLEDTPMPARWRKRLRHHFWRPQTFRNTLASFNNGATGMRSSISPHVDRLADKAPLEAVETMLSEGQIPLLGMRRPEEIAERLDGKFRDRSEPPLQAEETARLLSYLSISCPADQAASACAALGGGADFASSCSAFSKRLAAMEGFGLNPRRFEFRATFGYDLEYYTGFVFGIEAMNGETAIPVAGGGRYDRLFSDMGSPLPISAVGSAVHAERLRAALS